MTRLLLDQGLARSAAATLRQRGFDVRHVGEMGLGGATDEAIVVEAINSGSVIVTLDADFHSLIAVSGKSAPSVIRIRQEGLRAQSLAALIERVLSKADAALSRGALVTVSERNLRIHPLPVAKP